MGDKGNQGIVTVTGSLPVKVRQWQHIEDVYLSCGDSSNNHLKIVGPSEPKAADAKTYINNFKIYKVAPTYTDDISDGKNRFSLFYKL